MRSGFTALAAAVLLTAAADPRAGSSDTNIEALAWMAGAWTSNDGESWVEEHWTMPRGGVMLGSNLSGRGRNSASFEFLRIAADGNGDIHYLASPGGRPPIPFRLVSASENEAVFENPEHDFPTRIGYRRQGNRLIATISGPGGADAISWTFQRRQRLRPRPSPRGR